MKTMGNQDESVVIRVTEEEANVLVHEGFHYVLKEVWKKKVRDAKQPVEDKLIKAKSNKISKSAKRHLRKSGKE